jgi:hypothetical protein
MTALFACKDELRQSTNIGMKRPTGLLSFVTVAVAGFAVVLAVQACCMFKPNAGHTTFLLEISKPHLLKDPDPRKFAELLLTLSKSAIYDFHLVCDDGKAKDFRHGSKLSIKTDRIIKSELAEKESSGQLIPIGSSATHHLYSDDSKDIKIIANALK